MFFSAVFRKRALIVRRRESNVVWPAGSIFLAALVVAVAVSPATASIILPAGMLPNDPAALDASLTASALSGSALSGAGHSSGDRAGRPSSPDSSDDLLLSQLHCLAGPNSSSMVPVSSSGGPDTGGGTAVMLLPKEFGADYNVIGWLSPDRVGTWPMPPPSGLLRPPRI